MKRWIRFTGLGVLGFGLAAAVALAVCSQLADRKMHRRIDVAVQAVPFAADATSVERGRYLFMSRGCAECHGANAAGKDVVNDGKGMRVHAPNITPAPGSAVARYAAVDWVRTIRHGVKPNGEPLMLMPSEDYNRYTDTDLAAIVAYMRQLPAASGPGATVQYPLMVQVLYATGAIRDAAERIDHTLAPAQPIAEAVTAAHGAYVANACVGCHGAKLGGGKIPGTPPDWPPAANLTPGADSAMAKYPDARAFVAMLRSGKRPDGSAVSTVMPFGMLREMNDIDVQALYLHLKAVPPVAFGVRD